MNKHSPQEPLAVYVHWPWCKAKCPYCDFNSHAGAPRETDYVHGLLTEIQAWRGESVDRLPETPLKSASGRPITSLFFGGGTPSLMSPKSLEKIIHSVFSEPYQRDAAEITIECNPTSFTSQAEARAFFQQFRAAGVNRISIGIQGLNDDWLRFLGRTHSSRDALATLDAAQEVFDNVNADVIYGLPQQDLAEWQQLLRLLARRGLQHISAYQLTIEPNTAFFSDVRRGLWEPIPSDLEADFFEATQQILGAEGYENYEISNFCKPGFACRHNLHVWRYGDYLGIGAGAHGRLKLADDTRLATRVLKMPEAYLNTIFNDFSKALTLTPLSSAETIQEAFFAGLRLAEGVDLDSLQKTNLWPFYKASISQEELDFLITQGLLETTLTHLRLTRQGWPLLNGIIRRLFRDLPIADNSPRC